MRLVYSFDKLLGRIPGPIPLLAGHFYTDR